MHIQRMIDFKKTVLGIATFILIGEGFFAVGLLLFVVVYAHPINLEYVQISNTQVATSTEAIPALPVTLRIPAIGVEAHIQSVGLALDGGGDMGVPTNFTDVAWYKYGVRPGMHGSAVIDGHLSGKHIPQAVFYNLKKLNVGDLVEIIDASSTSLTFQVVSVKTYNHDAPTDEVFATSSEVSRLNLITCAGDWDSDKQLFNERTVVFTERVVIR